jgi:hypothetical protein
MLEPWIRPERNEPVMKTATLPAIGALLLTLFGIAQSAEPAVEPAAQPQPVYTRQGVFSIPFRIDGTESGGPQPAEVRLFVSEDQGLKWRGEGQVKPDQKSFGFRAPHDGEYWFSIRTIDKQGHSHPEGPYEPQLQVIVDTITPRLDLSAARGENGEIVARWHVLDTGLKADSFKLEYQSTPGDGWLPLAIDAQLQRAAKYTLVGEATWWPPANTAPVLLRATVADEAGNSAVSQVQIKADRVARTEPNANNSGHTASDRPPTSGAAAGPALKWPADASVDHPLDNPAGRAADVAGNRRQPADSTWRPAARGQSADNGRATDGTRVPAQMVSQSQTPAAGTGAADWSLMPIGERPRMVNLRTFELDYEVDSIGSSGVAKVELWGTRDGGRHWANFGADNDNRSPLVVSVDGEGVYGFRIVIQSGNGLSGQSPRDGDLPEVWIGVDLTRPAVKMTALEPGAEGGELAVRWEASDALLEGRPVSLFFSDQAHGPWTAIASGLESTGSFTWRLDNRVPERVYLRLEARDEAGNVGAYETPDPVSLDRQRPQGRIRGVRPLGQSPK